MMIQIKGTNLWAVKVLANYDLKTDDGNIYYSSLKGEFKLLGKVTKDNISFDVEPFLEYITIPNVGKLYEMPNCNDITKNKDEAFRSLLSASDLYWVNPMGEEKPEWNKNKTLWGHLKTTEFWKTYLSWQHYQDNLLSKTTKLLILNPVK